MAESKAAVFTDQQVAQYRGMVNWVYRVTRPQATADHAVATAYEQEAPLDPARLLPGAASSSSQPAELSTAESIRPSYSIKMRGTRSRSHDTVGHPAVAVPGTKNTEEPAGSPKEPRGAAGAEKPAGDPFDPEVFNRQFAPPPINPEQNTTAGPFPSPDAPPGNPQNPPEQARNNGQAR